MKRIVSLLLIVVLTASLLCFSSCGSINDSDVAILWAGEGEATNPNSLINSMERAMYIENIKYTHYGANYSAETQLQQAQSAVEGGAAALVVELVPVVSAASTTLPSQIVELARSKDIPVIFFNSTGISNDIIESYDKCVVVASDENSFADVQGRLIADYVKSNFKDLDKNKDGKLSFTTIGNQDNGAANPSAIAANALLATDDYKVKTESKEKINTCLEFFATDELTLAELIIVDNPIDEVLALHVLQERNYNTDKLSTQFVPIFTAGNDIDYKALVLAGRPAIPENLVIGENDSDKEIKNKDKEIKKLEELKKYYEENKNLVDLTAVNESDLDEMIYTTINVIDSGRIAGTALEDIDSMSLAVAEIVRNFIKGNDTFKNVVPKTKDGEPATVVVEGRIVWIRYTTYSN